MTQKHSALSRTKCSLTGEVSRCGIDELRVDVQALRGETQRLTTALDKLTSGADLEYYATVARQLVSVPETLEKIEKLLRTVLAEKTEAHEKVRQLESKTEDLEARVRLLESARLGDGGGTIRP